VAYGGSKIHLAANLYGYDKGNFDERVKFAMDHLEDIYDSAENPLDVRPLLLYTMVPFLLMCRTGSPMVDESWWSMQALQSVHTSCKTLPRRLSCL
jgi:hypothetical protein